MRMSTYTDKTGNTNEFVILFQIVKLLMRGGEAKNTYRRCQEI